MAATSSAISRRRALLVAAGALTTGCVPSSPRRARGFQIGVVGIDGRQAQSFSRSAHGAVDPVPVVGLGQPTPAEWEVAPVLPFLRPGPGTFAPVDAALHLANFQPGGLLPGILEALTATDGSHYGVPAYVGAWGIQYNGDVFDELGLQPPPPDWTIDDFEQDCAVVAAAIARGKLPRLRSVLPPLVGMNKTLGGTTGKQTVTVPGEFHSPALWGAFIQGFGGTAVNGGRFDLSNVGAMDGLQRIADIATRYGAPKPAAPQVPGFSDEVSRPVSVAGTVEWGPVQYYWSSPVPYAMTFAPSAGQGITYATPLTAKGWTWARFPVLPVRPVVPLQVTGFTVHRSGALGLEAAPPESPPGSLTALAEFAVWWYQEYRTTPGLLGLPAPPLGDTTGQHAYWNATGQAPGYPAVGDWQHFSVVETGWPVVPGAASKTSRLPVFDALTQAVTQRIPISRVLPQATQKLNAMVAAAQQAASTGKSG